MIRLAHGVKGRSSVSFPIRSRFARPLVLLALIGVFAGRLAAAPQSEQAASDPSAVTPAKLSYFTKLWQLDREGRVNKPGIALHRSNYGLMFSYNDRPNPAPLQEVDRPRRSSSPRSFSR
jgi:hypothetical protein